MPLTHTAQRTLQIANVHLQEAATPEECTGWRQKDFFRVLLKLGPQPGAK